MWCHLLFVKFIFSIYGIYENCTNIFLKRNYQQNMHYLRDTLIFASSYRNVYIRNTEGGNFFSIVEIFAKLYESLALAVKKVVTFLESLELWGIFSQHQNTLVFRSYFANKFSRPKRNAKWKCDETVKRINGNRRMYRYICVFQRKCSSPQRTTSIPCLERFRQDFSSLLKRFARFHWFRRERTSK